jgi:hypothetical protein
MLWKSRYCGFETFYKELSRKGNNVTIQRMERTPLGSLVLIGKPLRRIVSTHGSGNVEYIMIDKYEQAMQEGA